MVSVSELRRRLVAKPKISWDGKVWRAHNAKYGATDPGGSIRVSGRYNIGRDKGPSRSPFAALYLGTTPGVCLAEILRHVDEDSFKTLANRRFSQIECHLSRIADCRDVIALGLTLDQLLHDTDYSAGQALARTAVHLGYEGLLLPSASRFPDPIIVVFPKLLRSGSTLLAIDYIDPRLIVNRA